jgi:hypothetical protein
MPDLTRRPDPHRAYSWLVYYSDVHIGAIGEIAAYGIAGSICSGAAVDQTGALIASNTILRLVARERKHGWNANRQNRAARIGRHRGRLGAAVTEISTMSRWTDEELRALVTLWPTNSPSQIAKRLNRLRRAITSKATQLRQVGLLPADPPKGLRPRPKTKRPPPVADNPI